MSYSRDELDPADEQTAQRRYSRALWEQASKPRPIVDPTSNPWTRTGIQDRAAPPDSYLIGRVALTSPDPDLDGADFYIGETHATIDGMRVFSWTAPVACTFFRGSRHHEWCDRVAAIRAFVLRSGQVVRVTEEVVCEDALPPYFRNRGLAVPAAPYRALPLPEPATQPAARPAAGPQRVGPLPGVRAEELLRAQLQAPRARSLAPVLATLQPDQYDLVTEPAMTCMIVEGQPGTGKTIVASHRAAYLVNEQTLSKDTRDGDILLVGPTDGYTGHVQDVVGRLTGGSARVRVRGITKLMTDILGVRNEPSGPASRGWRDVDPELGEYATKAVYQLKSVNGPSLNAEQAYEYLRRNGEPRRPIAPDPEWGGYLRQLPPYRKALTLRAHVPLLALIRFLWNGAESCGLGSVGHIIVDEAQDVTPLEWYLLKEINRTIDWTLLGDLNQRRSDHTLGTWRQILEVLGVKEGEASVRTLQRGYRSTAPILQYANRLLPSRERAIEAFQAIGPAPSVKRVAAKELESAVVSEIGRLISSYPEGTVAIIAANPVTIRKRLRADGWAATSGGGAGTWERDGRKVMVFDQDAARGLEFDAVIVVEPADFPQNYGRQGPLYTALTRPNRELAIVHTKPLHDSLRRK